MLYEMHDFAKTLKHNMFKFFLSNCKVTVSNAYIIHDRFFMVYGSCIFQFILNSCSTFHICANLLHIESPVTAQSNFFKLCNSWSCACRAASCFHNVIFFFRMSLNCDYVLNSFKCLTVISVAPVTYCNRSDATFCWCIFCCLVLDGLESSSR